MRSFHLMLFMLTYTTVMKSHKTNATAVVPPVVQPNPTNTTKSPTSSQPVPETTPQPQANPTTTTRVTAGAAVPVAPTPAEVKPTSPIPTVPNPAPTVPNRRNPIKNPEYSPPNNPVPVPATAGMVANPSPTNPEPVAPTGMPLPPTPAQNSPEDEDEDESEEVEEEHSDSTEVEMIMQMPPSPGAQLSAGEREQMLGSLQHLAFGVSGELSKALLDFGTGDTGIGQEISASSMKTPPKIGPLSPDGCIGIVIALDYPVGEEKTTYCMWLMVNVKTESDLTNKNLEVLPWSFQAEKLIPKGGSGCRFVTVIVTQSGGEFDVGDVKTKATEETRVGFTGQELSGTLLFNDLSHLFRGAKPGVIIHTTYWVVCPDGEPGCKPGQPPSQSTVAPTVMVMIEESDEDGSQEEKAKGKMPPTHGPMKPGMAMVVEESMGSEMVEEVEEVVEEELKPVNSAGSMLDALRNLPDPKVLMKSSESDEDSEENCVTIPKSVKKCENCKCCINRWKPVTTKCPPKTPPICCP